VPVGVPDGVPVGFPEWVCVGRDTLEAGEEAAGNALTRLDSWVNTAC
jgi:hypothetical protein